MIDPSTVQAAAVRRRRFALGARFKGLALLPAGGPLPRNYAANTHPYRASSHFLYFVGLGLPDAWLLIDGERATVFAPPRPADDELWHGPTPSTDALAEATGCAFRDVAELANVLRGRGAATIPSVDAATRARQAELLGRPLDPPTEGDERLADAVIALRLVHDEEAQLELRAAAAATEAGHRAAMRATRPGILEAEVRAAFDAQFVAREMTHAYAPIVTVHGEVLHNHGHGHRLQDGDLLLADVGAESVGGFAADVTRTWPVNGTFSPTQRAIHDVVLAAQRAAIAKCTVGTRYRDVHLTAARVLTEGLIALEILRGDPDELVRDGVHALLFPHGVGHLLGLDVHDMEDLGDHAGYAAGRSRSPQFGLRYLRLDRDLVAGMAVTIEPGFYRVPAILRDPELRAIAKDRLDFDALERFSDVRGIRIEDDVLITREGPVVLTASIPKDAAEIEAAVG